MINRDGQINLNDGCSIDADGVKKHKYPNVAHINETVGAFTLSLLSGRTVRQHYDGKFDEQLIGPSLPSTEIRIIVGATVNTMLFASVATVTLFAMSNIYESFESFGRL